MQFKFGLFKQIFVFTLFIIGAAWTGRQVSAQEHPAPAFAEIDRLRAEGRYEEALELLEGLAQQESGCADVLWRLSRTRVDIGEMASSKDRQKDLYILAMSDAESAVEADSLCAPAHVAMAIAAGRVGLLSNTRHSVRLSRIVKKHVDNAVELDPDDDTSYHIRGRWHYEVSSLGILARSAVKIVYGGLPNASFQEAARDLEHALNIKDKIIHRLELGKAYMKLKRKDAAKAMFESVLTMPVINPDDPGYKEEAQVLLEKVD